METNFDPKTDCLWVWTGYDYETGCEFAIPKAFDDCPGCGKTTYRIDFYEREELEAIRKILAEYESE